MPFLSILQGPIRHLQMTPVTADNRLNPSTANPSTICQYQVAGYRYSTQGFYNVSDSAYSQMSGYTVKPPTGDTSEQTLFIDYFNLFYSKRGQEQISISRAAWKLRYDIFQCQSPKVMVNTSRSDQQISFGLNVPFGDITSSLNYSYSNNIWQKRSGSFTRFYA